MEDYQIALSPDLGLKPADFIVAWNEEAATRTNGQAHLAPSTGRDYERRSTDERDRAQLNNRHRR